MRSKCTWHCKMTLTLTLICCSTVVFHTPVTGEPELVQSAASTKPVFLKEYMNVSLLPPESVCNHTYICARIHKSLCPVSPPSLTDSLLQWAEPSPALPGSSPPDPSLFPVQSVSLFCIFNFADVLAEVGYSIIMLFLDLYFQPVKLVPCFFFFLLSFFPFLSPLFFHQAKATLNIVRASGATCHTWPQTAV